jgi:hypothetical protein
MIEPPLERLNYYNGQRLEAGDLKLEQEYHIRTRRWLNKSLYTTGIASGLDVREEKGTRTVIVGPGLALDGEGREILLLEEARLTVPGKPHKKARGSDAKVDGLYLTIRYSEESIHEERNGCVPQSERSKHNGSRPAWAGPARVVAKPQFNWRDLLPYESSGEVVLAQVELTPDCSKVHQINTGVRRYVGATSDAKVRQYALEGERHIDKDNPGRIYFHIRGRQPKAVTLYLRAEKFSTLYYTELGMHIHKATVSGSTQGASPPLTKQSTKHRHTAESLIANAGGVADHTHVLTARKGYIGHGPQDTGRAAFFLIEREWAIEIGPNIGPLGGVIPFVKSLQAPETDSAVDNILDDVNGVIDGGGTHTHSISGETSQHEGFDYDHKHALSGSGTTSSAGVTDPSPPKFTARLGAPLTFVDNLQVLIGPDIARTVNHTLNILNQLRAAQPTETWDKLGNGGGGHALVVKGTGEIKLDFLPNVAFTEGEYVIELRVDSGGGRILYNLYVE